MVDIKSINKENRTVTFDDSNTITYRDFINSFRDFLRYRIAGETLYPADMERFMRRTSGKNLSQLMKGKKMEGYMEGIADKLLTRGQKIAIGTVVTFVIVGVVVFIILKDQGVFGSV